MIDNNIITFAEESISDQDCTSMQTWKIVVVDDDESVHAVTRMILKNFEFEGKKLAIFSAYTDEQAKTLLAEHSDTAVVLLDVVMNEEDSGLKIVRYIREELKNRLVRIILRTGQPGHAPEKQVIIDYDINDYKHKTELTADKIFVTLVASLRSYSDLLILEYNRIGLEKIIESSASLFRLQNFRDFIHGVLMQLTALMKLNKNAIYCRSSAVSATKLGNHFIVEAAVGDFNACLSKTIEESLPPDALSIISEALEKKESVYRSQSFVAYFCSVNNIENLIYLTTNRDINFWDRRLIEIFCSNISVGLDNLLLGQEIENTQKEIIFTLGEVAEARSRETGNHVKRVAEFAAILATEYGLAKEDVELIRLATPMHDIGKLTIPDAILNKPAPLDEEERLMIQTHAQAGYEMLKTSNRKLMKLAATIALEHHEKYDGTGYPLGKKGNQISIYGRIVAIADVYDALGCDRVYKKAWNQNDIINFFNEGKGTWFDPTLTDIFLNNLQILRRISLQFPD